MAKLCLILAVFLAASALAVDFEREEWQNFKTRFNKSYSPVEEALRFSIFRKNLELVRSMNDKESLGSPYGVTKFMDLTPHEFKETYLMTTIPPLQKPKIRTAPPKPASSLPSSFDWRSQGDCVTPVKNQGQCGSCWDFSATETLESVCCIAGYAVDEFSEQQILDCDTSDYGCNGGWPYNAYQYVINAGGIESEANYPYQAVQGSCNANSGEFETCKPISWEYVTQDEDETQMQQFLMSNSPLSVCVDAESWQFYTGGVIDGSNCGTQIDHCVQAVGWTSVQGTPAWIVRNSWGTDWGMQGYLYVQMGVDACAIAQIVTVPCVTSTSGSTVC